MDVLELQATSIDVVKMGRQLQATHAAYRRFLPAEAIQNLGVNVLDLTLGTAVNSNMTVMFSDVRQFTHISESIPAQDTFSLLNNIFEQLCPVIYECNGFVEKFIGDCVDKC